jgi:hypothetical protein
MHPIIALVTAGVEMDVLGIGYSEFSNADREAIVGARVLNVSLRQRPPSGFWEFW